MRFENIYLEADQEDLLVDLVEAVRAVERGDRRPFFASLTIGSSFATLMHPGLPSAKYQAYPRDIEELGRVGLLRVSSQRHGYKFDVSPLGFEYFEEVRRRSGEAPERVMTEMRHHLDSQAFRERCPAAYESWEKAESLLWTADSEEQLTAIGHHCREALQECVHALLVETEPSAPVGEKPKTVARAKRLLGSLEPPVSKTVSSYLDALLNYWGAVIDVVQRQEHGAAKEGSALKWEDGRRVVVGTLIVMTELVLAVPDVRGRPEG